VFEYTETGKIYKEIPYYFQKNLQGDIIAIVDKDAQLVARYSYDAWGKILSITDKDGNPISPLSAHVANINPYRYRGYYYDTEIGLYYLQSRYYNPKINKFVNADQQFGSMILGTNLFAYCENSSIVGADHDGRRTYFLNGIGNANNGESPSYAKDFANKLMEKKVRDVRCIPLYDCTGLSPFKQIVSGVVQVIKEMLNIDVFTNNVVERIKKQLKEKKLARGEQLNLIGYSGGGQVALNVMEKMKNKFNHVVLIGAPVLEFWRSTTKVSLIYAGWDPLSWNIGFGFKSYFAGWFGHTGYFNRKNINKVANIVNKIID